MLACARSEPIRRLRYLFAKGTPCLLLRDVALPNPPVMLSHRLHTSFDAFDLKSTLIPTVERCWPTSRRLSEVDGRGCVDVTNSIASVVVLSHPVVVLGGGGTSTEPVMQRLNRLSDTAPGHRLTMTSMTDLYASTRERRADHAVVIVSDTRATATDREVTRIATWCLAHFVPVYFVCDTTEASFPEQAPKVLRKINGLPYQTPEELDEVCNRILHLIGYDERDRSVFISYRRQDGEQIAHDLRYALIDRGWDVFLDRYIIPPGSNFQAELTRDLDGRGLVLVIESPTITTSAWVEYELAFARRHGIGIHAVCLPETARGQQVPGLEDERRTNLSHDRFVPRDGGQVPPGLPEVIARLQRAHTFALRTRRQDMLDSVHTVLDEAGFESRQLDDWTIVGWREGFRRVVVLAVPRTPRPADLQQIQKLRGARGIRRGCVGWVVHPLEDIDLEHDRLLRWLTRRRAIHVCPLLEFRERLQP